MANVTKVRGKKKTPEFPVFISTPSSRAAAYSAAMAMVDGDKRRLRREPDGSVTILNQPA